MKIRDGVFTHAYSLHGLYTAYIYLYDNSMHNAHEHIMIIIVTIIKNSNHVHTADTYIQRKVEALNT